MDQTSATVRLVPGPVPSHDGAGRLSQHDHGRLPDELALSVLDALPIGVTVHDQDGACLHANPAAMALGLGAPGDVAAWSTGAEQPAEIADDRDGSRTTVETLVQTFVSGGRRFWLQSATDISERRKIERELFNRAYLDELTGLANRSLVQQSTESLIEALGVDGHFALAFVDLDNFKHINDYYSHAVGDQLLMKVAARLADAVGGDNMVARIGGDEFVLLLTHVADSEDAHREVETLSRLLKQPFFIDSYEIFASASIGVSLYPQHGYTYDMLRRNADNAMYRVKSGIKGGVLLFDTTMGQAATARMALEQRLRLAIRDRRFCCAFQPKVDLRSHAVVGVEVLLRWRDEHGLIKAPGDFVGLAVELGLINEISHLVLAETMRLLDEIDHVFGPDVSISINVAAKQAEDHAFMQSFVEAIAATGCARRFMVELTEEAFFAKNRFQTDILPQLRAIGTKVSIDDFGVGFSSLSALADITADEIKIDRSFITDIHRRPRSQSVLRAIESLSHALGMSITAEGVETEEELIYLQAATRIHHAQGFFFAKPLMLGLDDTSSTQGPHGRYLFSRDASAGRDVPLRPTSGRSR